MGKGSGSILKYKPIDKDPDDVRRVQEIETNFQPRAARVFKKNPSVKVLVDGEAAIVNDGDTVTKVRRVGNKLYLESTLTEI